MKKTQEKENSVIQKGNVKKDTHMKKEYHLKNNKVNRDYIYHSN